MPKFAVIKDSVVSNKIVADSKEIAEEATGYECIEITEDIEVKFDWIWDGNTFTSPIVETPVTEGE